MHIYGRKIFSDKENPITIFYKLKSKFKDISINGKKNLAAKWEDPNGDKLLDDVILNSCKTV